MNKKIVRIMVIALLVLGIAMAAYNNGTKKSVGMVSAEEIKEITVKRGDIKINFLADGNASLPSTKLKFTIGGKLKEVMFDVGDMVKKGDVIAKLEDKEYMNRIESFSNSYEQAIAKLEKTKKDYELQLLSEKAKVDNLKYQLDSAKLQYQAVKQIPDAYPAQEIESRRIVFESAFAAYETALQSFNLLAKGSPDIKLDEMNIEQARINLNSSMDTLDDTILRSPIDGEVLSIEYSIGETVPNSNDGPSFAVITDINNLNVTSRVSEIDVSKITKGQEVDIEFEAFQGKTFKGTVSFVDPIPVVDSSGIVDYIVDIEIEDIANDLRDGMTCSVSFVLKQKQSVLIIPNSAVKRSDGKQVVEVKDKNGDIILKNIRTGLTDGMNVEVADGLSIGDVVVIRSSK